jgi:hypothetical protein
MQTPIFEYVHSLDGRLRLKVPEVRRSPAHAERVEALFRGLDGIREVRANPLTGNVLFLHDPDRIAAREIMGALVAHGYMGMGADGLVPRDEPAVALATSFADVVIKLIVRALPIGPVEGNILTRLAEAVARFLIRFALGRPATATA